MPTILALDFDGVICDGLIEYFQTAWRAYCRLWNPTDTTPPAELAPQFYRLRPVVETGWEMPLVLRSLLNGRSEAELLEHWGAIAQEQLAMENLASADLGMAVDSVRDEWIAADLDHWLAQHRFYPGIIERLQQVLTSSVHLVIITTKEGRFVRKLLAEQGITVTDAQIMGKEIRQPKAQSLRDVLRRVKSTTADPVTTWFIEDRLKTLQTIKTEADLQDVRLFLADWGYNTVKDRAIAQQDDRIQLISLETIAQDFACW